MRVVSCYYSRVIRPITPASLDELPLEGNYFVPTWPPFARWTVEAVPRFEHWLGQPLRAPSLGLYVHVPFCVERCHYCYYRSYDDRPAEMGRYLAAVCRELRLYAERPALAGRRLGFVYFGGGTPSLLSVGRLRELFVGLREAFPWNDVREVSFECAPKSTTERKLRALRELGVTRISLGVQQLDDRVLAANGRIHGTADVERAWTAIRRVGFDVSNIDLIVGLVGETDGSFERSLERTLRLAPDGVTIYQLEIPYGTPLARTMREGRLPSPPASWSVKRARLARAFERLEAAGYVMRSAYSAVRDTSRHEFVYQHAQYHGADLLGIGVAAFSYLDGIGQQNLATLDPYLAAVEVGRLPLGRAYVLSEDERMTRELLLQLKLGGFERAHFQRKFVCDVVERFAGPFTALERSGLLTVTPDAVRLTREGLLRADHLILALDPGRNQRA